jgi:exopolysaccharide biosynthesis polyprenyl glycosylphosphotransferase
MARTEDLDLTQGRTSAPRFLRRDRDRRTETSPAELYRKGPVHGDEVPQTEPYRSHQTARRDRRYRRLLAVSDVVATLGALVICIPLLGEGDDRLPTLLLAALPLVVLIGKLLGLYDRDELVLRKSTLDEGPKLFQVATVFSLVLWISEQPLSLGDLGGKQVLGLWVGLCFGLVAGRVAARAIARTTTPPERCLLLGDPEVCERVRTKIARAGALKATVVGQVTLTRISEDQAPSSILTRLAAANDVQRVIIAPRSTDHGDTLNLVRAAKAAGLNVSVLPRLLEVVGSSVVVDDVDGLRILGLRRFGLSRSSLIVKRSMDVAASTLGLVLVAPLWALIALAIKLDTRGPVFFRQRRVGRADREFDMLKFRTMVPDAERLKADLADRNEASGLFKIADDPRITWVGRFLRVTSLDELPQLLNVLRGEMSLVGPRPLVSEDDSRIQGWDRGRLHLTPGMTGPWQVLGGARIPLDEMVKIDYLYVANWSLWGDVKILVRTLGFVLGRRGM